MRSILLATTALSLGTFLPLTAPAQNIGNVAAVNRDMAGTPPTADRRLLQLGNNVVRNERIETSDEGAGQLMFIDQTSLTVSPNTDIRLDEYVYDPATDTGDVALTMTRGALRFIGGRISKNRRALVRTPTATIGIRGGMVLLEVEEGVTKVTHLAGESTTVVSFGDNDGDGVDDGPAPGEELEQFLSGGDVPAAEQVTLSRTSSTATTGEPQQDGQPTEVQFTGLTDSSELEEVFGGFEGNQDGGTESPPTDADIEQQTQPIAQINSEVPGGQNTQPVSTTGESSEGIRSDSEPQELPPQELETTPSQDTAIENEIDPDTGDLALLPEGGALFVPGVGLDVFTSITQGSIIGTTADGQTVTLNVPASATDLLATNPFTGGSFFAQTRFPNSGFFLIESGQAVSSELGELTGIGFADFDNEFILAGVENEFEEPALIFFGTNTDNQNGFFTSDPTAPAGANSITQYVIEAELDNPNDTSTDLLSIVSNGGTDASDGRAIFAEVLIEADQGGQTSELSVLAAPLVRREGGGPALSSAVLSSASFPFGSGSIEFSTSNIGTVEDAQRHTLFGPNADYIVVSSAFRDSTTGEFVVDDPGETLAITEQGNIEFVEESDVALLTRNPEVDFVVADPLPLANDTTSTIGIDGALEGVFATGFASCGDGRTCGQQLTDSSAPGFYSLTPIRDGQDPALTSGFIDFVPGGQDQNTLQPVLLFTDNGQSGFQPGSDGGDVFAFTPVSQSTAYIDDDRFAVADTAAPSVIGGTVTESEFTLASAGLANPDDLFPTGVESQPQYVRWGWFSAKYSGQDQSTQQIGTDIVHLGTFVAGKLPDPSDFGAFQGTAQFAGFAAGTQRDLSTGAQIVDVGSSMTEFNFATRTGTVDIQIDNLDIDQIFAVDGVGAINNPQFAGVINQTDLSARVEGNFFAGGGDPVAAAGGTFDILDTANDTHTLGVFGGDRVTQINQN